MEHLQGTVKNNSTDTVYPYEYEQASNAYLMAVVCVIAGLPLPILNVIASCIYYMGHRKSSYFVRWHSIQAIIAQALIIPLNSIAFAWTVSIIFRNFSIGMDDDIAHAIIGHNLSEASIAYWLYMFFIIVLNIIEFFAVIFTAIKVRAGHNVRWLIVANITDSLCSKENRDPYRT